MATELLSSTWQAQNFFETTLSADCTDSDTDIFLTSVPDFSEGTLVIDPDSVTGREIIYYSSKTTTKVTCPANGRGYDNSTAGAHTSGTKVIMAPIADWFNSLKTLFTTTPQGYTDLAATPNTVTYNGNRNYTLVFNSTDLTDTLSEGMRLRLQRTVSAPTTAFLIDGVNDYYNDTTVAGMTFTDDFVAGAWIYVRAYADMKIMGRYNGTSGWNLALTSSGQIQMGGNNAGAANFRAITSYQCVPLNKWVHIAAQLDMSAHTATSTTSYIMIDGVDVPAFVSQGGTNPTALIQAGNFELGSFNGGTQPFNGYIDQAFVTSAKMTQANVRTIASQAWTAALISTHSVVSAYSNGSTTDLNTTNANNLTAQNGATTVASSPFGNYLGSTLEYGIVASKPTFSTNTTVVVQVPEGCAIPTSGGISAVSYSTNKQPYGFPIFNPVIRTILLHNNSTATSQALVSGLTLSHTAQSTIPYKVRLRASSIYNGNSAVNAIVALWDGTVGSGTQLTRAVHSMASANIQSSFNIETPVIYASGSKTYNVSLEGNGGGTSTIAAATTAPVIMELELVGIA